MSAKVAIVACKYFLQPYGESHVSNRKNQNEKPSTHYDEKQCENPIEKNI